jgi:hypothetical protein
MSRINAFTPVFNTANGGSADIFGADLIPQGPDSVFTIGVCLSAAVKLNLMIDDGTTTITVVLNDDSNLTANAGHTFTFPAHSSYTYNLQPSGSATVLWCSVRDVCSGGI